MASLAPSSPIATTQSSPAATYGQAAVEGVGQLSSAMIVSCGPGTETIRPARSEASTPAAESGSTPISRVRRSAPAASGRR